MTALQSSGAARYRQVTTAAPAATIPVVELSRAERVQAAVPGLRFAGGDPDGVTRWDARHLRADQYLPVPVDVPAVVRIGPAWDALAALAVLYGGAALGGVTGWVVSGDITGVVAGVMVTGTALAVVDLTVAHVRGCAAALPRHSAPHSDRGAVRGRVAEDPS